MRSGKSVCIQIPPVIMNADPTQVHWCLDTTGQIVLDSHCSRKYCTYHFYCEDVTVLFVCVLWYWLFCSVEIRPKSFERKTISSLNIWLCLVCCTRHFCPQENSSAFYDVCQSNNMLLKAVKHSSVTFYCTHWHNEQITWILFWLVPLKIA